MGRAEAVGVLLSERLSYAFSDPFAVEFLTGLSEVVEEHGISIVLMPLSRPTAGSTQADSDVTAIRHANIDALAIHSMPPDHPAAVLAKARGIRLVTTDASSDPESSWVAIDDSGAGVMVGEHLAGLGHRDLVVLAETNQPAGSPGRRLAESGAQLPRLRRPCRWSASGHGRSDHDRLRWPQLPRIGCLGHSLAA
jgi:DNA-binding LacI/PurR family transcriptional regulator